MLRQESDMWARSMELDAQQRRRAAAETATTRRRQKLQEPNTFPVGQWKVAQATRGSVTLYDFEVMLGGAPGPSTILLYETDLAAMSQLIHQVRLGGRIG